MAVFHYVIDGYRGGEIESLMEVHCRKMRGNTHRLPEGKI